MLLALLLHTLFCFTLRSNPLKIFVTLFFVYKVVAGAPFLVAGALFLVAGVLFSVASALFSVASALFSVASALVLLNCCLWRKGKKDYGATADRNPTVL
jgi:hypothetical protein